MGEDEVNLGVGQGHNSLVSSDALVAEFKDFALFVSPDQDAVFEKLEGFGTFKFFSVHGFAQAAVDLKDSFEIFLASDEEVLSCFIDD